MQPWHIKFALGWRRRPTVYPQVLAQIAQTDWRSNINSRKDNAIAARDALICDTASCRRIINCISVFLRRSARVPPGFARQAPPGDLCEGDRDEAESAAD